MSWDGKERRTVPQEDYELLEVHRKQLAEEVTKLRNEVANLKAKLIEEIPDLDQHAINQEVSDGKD